MRRLDVVINHGLRGVIDPYTQAVESEDGDFVWWDEAENEIDAAVARVCTLWRSSLDGPTKAATTDSAEMAELATRTRNAVVIAGRRVAGPSDSDRTALATAVFELKERLGAYKTQAARFTEATDPFVREAYEKGVKAVEEAIEVVERMAKR